MYACVFVIYDVLICSIGGTDSVCKSTSNAESDTTIMLKYHHLLIYLLSGINNVVHEHAELCMIWSSTLLQYYSNNIDS